MTYQVRTQSTTNIIKLKPIVARNQLTKKGNCISPMFKSLNTFIFRHPTLNIYAMNYQNVKLKL